jgi:hypothetical protein
MSESLPFEIADELRSSDRSAYLEQAIFVYSPFGTHVTAVLIFSLFAVSYLLLAGIGGVPIVQDYALSHITRLALVLSLMMTVILWIQRFVRLRARADTILAARVLRGGLAQAKEIVKLTPSGAHLRQATLIGIVLGAAFDWFLYFSASAQLAAPLGVKLWFSFITMVMVLTFVRGVELTRTGARATVEVMENDLVVDLLRVEELSVWGRNSARFALIWFVISAAACLLFVSSEITIFTLCLLIGCVAMGIAAFVGLMLRVHHKILHAKQAELERVRREIVLVCDRIAGDADAAARIQGLLAYEARIMAVREWPFDQTTLMRFVASAFILTVPWFGQAIAAFAVEHVAK